MYNPYRPYPYPYPVAPSPYVYPIQPQSYWANPYGLQYLPCSHHTSTESWNESSRSESIPTLRDYGPNPFTININQAAKQNDTYRTAIWTGEHLQVTLMSINVGDDIGLEIHPTTDQFLRVEDGQGLVQMGKNKDRLDFQRQVRDDSAIMVPAGTWHNVINTGNKPLKLYTIYAPPHHPRGTVQRTKAEAEAAENHHNY
ncbi:hypothetical protein BEP19_15280 [Ammoniphilus oxalaticus]|uniref:Cupin type-2 domain-containing protein n=1 Tax=Ammoniphilus oxalaticus TaxID=66863 RepID=A0A419SDH7_9BACL|nr:cupin domain-containing protein [Ammoniphilus oxalaticus]RKD21040.1 hypothetical protein BEP19_15280 [Ammoniphilus oxalaticus]